eukprot:134481-Amphidinium_carterae.3
MSPLPILRSGLTLWLRARGLGGGLAWSGRTLVLPVPALLVPGVSGPGGVGARATPVRPIPGTEILRRSLQASARGLSRLLFGSLVGAALQRRSTTLGHRLSPWGFFFGAAAACACCQAGLSVRTTSCGLSGSGGTGGLVPSREGATTVLARSIF